MQNPRLDEAQAGIKIEGEISITSDTQMIPLRKWLSEEELKSLLMKVKESEKDGLKLNIQKTKIMASSLITSWQINGVGNSDRFYFLGLQNSCRWCLQP